MANEIRVLGLNDDNNATHFYSEDEVINVSASEMISFLAQAHTINYNIRSVYVCDMPEGDLFDDAFEVLPYSTGKEFTEAFNILWGISSQSLYL